MTSAIRARREAESGFTLIELLVVVIIIGILAAIAIPAFLNQRERAWQSELTSTVRNVALEVEAEATQQGGDYSQVTNGTSFAGFVTDSLNDLRGTNAGVVTFDTATATANEFVLCADHTAIQASAGDHNVTYDSDGGGLQDYVEGTAC